MTRFETKAVQEHHQKQMVVKGNVYRSAYLTICFVGANVFFPVINDNVGGPTGTHGSSNALCCHSSKSSW